MLTRVCDADYTVRRADGRRNNGAAEDLAVDDAEVCVAARLSHDIIGQAGRLVVGVPCLGVFDEGLARTQVQVADLRVGVKLRAVGYVVEGGAAASCGGLLRVGHRAAVFVSWPRRILAKIIVGGLGLDRHACEVGLASNGLRPFNPDEPGRFD